MVSFVVGFLLFVLDILALLLLFRHLWQRSTRPSSRRLLVWLGVAKLPLLGGGVYVSLVVLKVDVLLFVGGALAALLLVSGGLVARQLGTGR